MPATSLVPIIVSHRSDDEQEVGEEPTDVAVKMQEDYQAKMFVCVSALALGA